MALDHSGTDLLSAWKVLQLEGPPYVFPGDLAVLAEGGGRWTVSYPSFEDFIDSGLAAPEDPRLHLGLLPQPWVGDPETASVFLLLLNPGFEPCDYFAEARVPAYREALVSNLRLVQNRRFPQLFLDPAHAWHLGARYWRSRLHWLAAAIAEDRRTSYLDALSLVAREVCCIQMVPYHSASFALPARIVDRLESVAVVKAFVRRQLDKRSDLLVILMRRVEAWDLPDRPSVVRYQGAETRSAHLSRRSRRGQALARHFALPVVEPGQPLPS